jgi:hypothetical protein
MGFLKKGEIIFKTNLSKKVKGSANYKIDDDIVYKNTIECTHFDDYFESVKGN